MVASVARHAVIGGRMVAGHGSGRRHSMAGKVVVR